MESLNATIMVCVKNLLEISEHLLNNAGLFICSTAPSSHNTWREPEFKPELISTPRHRSPWPYACGTSLFLKERKSSQPWPTPSLNCTKVSWNLSCHSVWSLRTVKYTIINSQRTAPVLRGEVNIVSLFFTERLLKMPLEELREFLQEKIAESLDFSDDVVIEQLQVSMTELRKMKLDLPSPGYIVHVFQMYICSENQRHALVILTIIYSISRNIGLILLGKNAWKKTFTIN